MGDDFHNIWSIEMKRLAATAATAALVLLASMAPALAQNLGGKYSVFGTNFDGSHYKGTATITIKSSTTCEIEWQTGSTTSQGICMRNDDAFSAAYQLGKDVGLVIYKMHSDGVLDGLWTIAGQDGNGTEVLTPDN
jgi:hypothetical protein